ncbi:hypothetical protein CA13_70200 [Planctomycetes bacterium CA13]|uniref:Copper resistance protein D n=1 Tax=Novipirellula herctigrandis TaxID=2527986 RepID=A0A5C5YNS6_9BACT|nr:hypothetical protein CA13_70200 [Planctomycetes bacterium CA13]
MFALDVVSRVIHIATAITLVGGSTFMLLVLMPSAKQLDDASHQRLSQLVIGRWKRFVHAGILLFILSGIYNYVRAIPNHEGDGIYHALVGTKILIALVIFFLASGLVGKSSKLEWMRKERAKWLARMLVLAVVVVVISGFLKVSG